MTHSWSPEPERGAAPGEPAPAWSSPSGPYGPAAQQPGASPAQPYAQPYAQQPAQPYGQPNAQPYPQPQGQPYAQQPYAQQPYAQQPYAQQPYAQQPYAQQPYAQQPYAQQPYAQQPYAQPYGPPFAPSYSPPRRGMPGWAIALLVLGGLFALMIAAAVAIPVFLNARAGDAGLGDYAGVTCAQAARDAVLVTEDIAWPGDPLLVQVHSAEVFVDHRGDVEPPEPGGYELVLTCSGVGEWDDGSSGPILLDVGVEYPAELVISYRPGF